MPKNSAPTILTFFDAPGFKDYPFTFEEYWVAYHEVAELFHAEGAVFGLVRSQSTYLGGNDFNGGWLYDGKEFVRHDERLTCDLIYNKGHFVGDAKAKTMNVPELDELCTDKWKTYEMFPELFPVTRLVTKKEDLPAALESLPEGIVVAKPVGGEEAKGVVIGSKAEVLAAKHDFPVVAQAFLDTSGGLPGIIEGKHDLRIIGIQGEIGVSYARKPKAGLNVSNVSMGGQEIGVEIEHIPADAMALYKKVDAALAKRFPYRIYCVDMGRDNDGVYRLFELNSKPGLSDRSRGQNYVRFQKLLVQGLLKAARA